MNECKVCDESLTSPSNNLREGYEAYKKDDYEEALRLLLPLAEEGQAMAQCLSASMYHLGLGVIADAQIAEKLYLRAAKQGCPVSCNNLATLYSTTYVGVEGKEIEARKYLEKAKALGFDIVAE